MGFFNKTTNIKGAKILPAKFMQECYDEYEKFLEWNALLSNDLYYRACVYLYDFDDDAVYDGMKVGCQKYISPDFLGRLIACVNDHPFKYQMITSDIDAVMMWIHMLQADGMPYYCSYENVVGRGQLGYTNYTGQSNPFDYCWWDEWHWSLSNPPEIEPIDYMIEYFLKNQRELKPLYTDVVDAHQMFPNPFGACEFTEDPDYQNKLDIFETSDDLFDWWLGIWDRRNIK